MSRLTERYDDNSGYGAIEENAYEQHLYIDLSAYDDCVNKLGQYEDIDEDPEHLAKVKKAFEIIKEKRVDIGRLLISKNVEEYNDYVFCYYHVGLFGLMQLEYDLLKEVLL